ncbi:MAG TPA: methyltransferase domain-containing protein [Candidatus Methylomirabilis sp.]|nr:methyltransferase domain-containing protein [Candidatus Methylomirabilis sp.]
MRSEMKYVPQGWYQIPGWNDQGIADAQERHWPTLVRNVQGPGPLGVSHLPWRTTREDRADHNILMSYGYVLARAARTKDRLTILDWGGGVGHYYLYSKALLPEVELEYECYDLPSLCRAGRKLQPDIRFHDDDKDLLGKPYDLVISSSSLHYFENWREQVRRLAACTGGFLYVARLQAVTAAPSFVAVHRPDRAGYSEFLSWCINRQEFLGCAEEHGLELMREFVFTERWNIRGAPEKAECRGFLLRRSLPKATIDG